MSFNFLLSTLSSSLSESTKLTLIITFSCLGAAIFLFIVVSIVFGETFFRLTCCKRKKKQSKEQEKTIYDEWFDKQECLELNVISKDMYKQCGYFLNNHSDNKLALLVHGMKDEYTSLKQQAKMFTELGYDVLLINLRAHGTSEGKFITMGVKESEDIARWIELMSLKNPKYQIVLYGVSLGAHSVARASMTPNNNIKAVIFDCGYFDLKKQLAFHIKHALKLRSSRFITANGILHSKLYHHVYLYGNLNECLSNSKYPFLFIHGEGDTFIPLSEHESCVKAFNKETFMMSETFPDSEHSNSIKDHPEEYAKLVKEFLDKVIK